MNLTPIVTCSFHTETVKQYTTIHIGYSVYDPTSMNADVEIKRNGVTISTQTIGRSKQDFAVRMDTVGTFTFEISSGEASRSFTLEVTESDIQIEAETEALSLYLTSNGRSNTEENRSEWKYGDVTAQLSGFPEALLCTVNMSQQGSMAAQTMDAGILLLSQPPLVTREGVA